MKWFKHETRAFMDEKIQNAMECYGPSAYAVYFILCELCGEKISKETPPIIKITLNFLKRFTYIYHESQLVKILVKLHDLQLISILSPDDVHLDSQEIIEIKIDNMLKRLDEYTRDSRVTHKPAPESSLSISLLNTKQHTNTNKHSNNILNKQFDLLWKQYPNKDGRKEAQRHFNNSVKTEKDFEDIKTALENYLISERVSKGFVKNGSTWFNNWKDWIEPIQERRVYGKLKSGEEVTDLQIARVLGMVKEKI